jgi:hypothetical protein
MKERRRASHRKGRKAREFSLGQATQLGVTFSHQQRKVHAVQTSCSETRSNDTKAGQGQVRPDDAHARMPCGREGHGLVVWVSMVAVQIASPLTPVD